MRRPSESEAATHAASGFPAGPKDGGSSPCSASPLLTTPAGSQRSLSSTAPKSVPLLKFDADKERPHLCDAGLALIAALPPPVAVVTILGDGRCGKSTLASRLCDDERQVFSVGDTGKAVTEGIDICVVPRGAGSEGSLVVMDCEGGNNPTGAIRSAVDLVAMLASTLTVQVVWGQMSEGQLLQIGQGIAIRDRLLQGQADLQLPTQRLMLVVNGCHLRYEVDQVEQSFSEVHSGYAAARNELRANIKRAYEKICFLAVPMESEAGYSDQLEALRRDVAEHCVPLRLGGSRLSGTQIAEVLKSAVSELRRAGSVPVPSVFRHVIYDHLLAPLVTRLQADFEAGLPDLNDGDFRPLLQDRRSEVLAAFEAEAQHLTHVELVAEARRSLAQRLDERWNSIFDKNAAIGNQHRDVTTESEMRYSHTEERVVAWKRSCGIMGRKKPLVEASNVFRIWTRTRCLKKNGQVIYTEWAPSAHSVDGTPGMSSCSSACAGASMYKSPGNNTQSGASSPVVPGPSSPKLSLSRGLLGTGDS